MFEQSIVATQPANKTWTLGVSILAQMSLVSAAILFPLVYTDNLPGLSQWVEGLVMPPPAAAAPKPLPEQASRPATQSTVSERPAFVAPPRPLTQLDTTPDETRIEPYEPFVIGSTGPAVTANPISRYLSHAPVLPKPEPPVRHAVTPEAKPQEPFRVSSTIQEAKLLRKIIPIYPQIAIIAHVQGTVHLVGVISKEGTIRNLQAIDGNPLLIHAALDAVKQWVYRPTILNGEPVEVIAPIVVTFILSH
jgi:periplasmic protein TonB